MAYSSEKWERARGYFEAGLSLREIEEKTDIDYTAIRKKAISQQWKKGENIDYIKAREIIAEKKSTKSQQVLNCADEVADYNIRIKRLIQDSTIKAIEKASAVIDRGTNIETIIDSEGEKKIEKSLTPHEYKAYGDLIDKISITSGISQRHANAPTINNQTQEAKILNINLIKEKDVIDEILIEAQNDN